MICPKCGNNNINVQAVTTTKTKKHGIVYWICFIWLFDFMIWILFFLPRLVLQLFKKNKLVSKTHTEAVCQNCGHRWKVK